MVFVYIRKNVGVWYSYIYHIIYIHIIYIYYPTNKYIRLQLQHECLFTSHWKILDIIDFPRHDVAC